MSRFSVDTQFRAIDGFSAAFKRMEGAGSRAAKTLKSSFAGLNSTFDAIGNGLRKAAAVGVIAGGAGALGIQQMVSAGLEFDSTMVEAGAKFGLEIKKGTAEYAKLQAQAEKTGATTAFNATQAAGALKELASAGFKVDAAIAALPGVADFAVAAGVKDLNVAAEMAGKSLGAFSMKSNDPAVLAANLTKLTDVMAKTADATSASMEGLFETIADGAPVAVMAGQSVETFMAMAGKLADAGIEGSVASTTLKNAFLLLAAPTKEAAGQLAKFGIKTKDADGNMRDALDIMQELGAATDKLGSADKAGALEHIFGKIPIAGIGALLGGGVAGVKKLRTELEGAKGTTAKFAALFGDRLAQDIDNASGAIEGVKVKLFTVAEGPMRKIVQATTAWIDANKEAWGAKFRTGLTWAITNFGLIVDWLKQIARGVLMFYGMAAAVRVATVALTAFQLASRAAAVITTILAVATSRSWIMYGLMTAALWLDTAATWASVAAKTVWRGLTSLGVLAVGLLVTATQASTYSTAANTAVTWLSTAARTAWTTIVGLGSAALAAYNAGTLLSTIRLGALTAVTWLANAANLVLNATLLANPYVLIGIAVVALVGYLLKVLGVWDAVSNAVKKFGSWAMSYISPVVSMVSKLFGLVSKTVDALDDLPTGLPGFGTPGADGLPGAPGFNMEQDAAGTTPFSVVPDGAMPVMPAMAPVESKLDVTITAPPGYSAEAKSPSKNTSVKVSHSGGGIVPAPAYGY